MTIVAQDPSVRYWDAPHLILRASVRVPADRFEPGPRGHRFHVVDYDASRDVYAPPDDVATGRAGEYRDRFKAAADEVLVGDPWFLAQNAYAIAARTLAAFESALGRRLTWAFPNHQLFVVPRAFAEPNAYYATEDAALYFGYFPRDEADPKDLVYACLSHDVVAHETTHAILDGLRPRYQQPSLPDQAAFHEAFADVVALLSVFSIREVVENALGPGSAEGRVPAAQATEDWLRESVLVKIAEEMGEARMPGRGNGLRQSIKVRPGAAWRQDPAFEEPHRRGEVLVAAVVQTLLEMWTRRLAALVWDDSIDRGRAAEEGAKSAEHLLRMMIRALDYTPPVELALEDVLDAVLTADEELAPDDEHAYRPALERSFGSFDIHRPSHGIVHLSLRSERPTYDNLNFAALRASPDEVARFLWQNASLFDIDTDARLDVECVSPSVRIGPDGFVVAETVAYYVQSTRGSAAALRRASNGRLNLPPTVDEGSSLEIWGGGSVIFDQFGAAKLHAGKPIGDWTRQSERLAYLVRRGLRDRRGGYGASLGIRRGQLFAALHAADRRAGESW